MECQSHRYRGSQGGGTGYCVQHWLLRTALVIVYSTGYCVQILAGGAATAVALVTIGAAAPATVRVRRRLRVRVGV